MNASKASVGTARVFPDPARVSVLLEGASFPAALWSGSELKFTWMNSVFRDMLEDVRPQWDLLGMPVRGFMSDSRSASRFIDVAYTGQPITVPAYEFKASWGEVTYWQLSYLPVPGRIGHPFDVLLLAVLGFFQLGLPCMLLVIAARHLSATELALLALLEVLLGPLWAWLGAGEVPTSTTIMGGALVLGALVVAGWYVTGHLGYGENPETLETVFFATNTRTLESLSFVAPLAFSLELLMLWTDASLHVTFGIASVLGVIAGSAAYALASKSFRWEGFASMDDLRNQLVGAMLMGFGGVTALGCTIGQGLSGLSTLAIGSFIAVAGIMAGSVATLKYLLWKMEQEG